MTFAIELAAMQARLHLTPKQLSEYLGVSHGAVRHWLVGSRVPDAAVRRLVTVLQTVETLAPDVHAHLLPTTVAASPRKRRVARAATVPAWM